MIVAINHHSLVLKTQLAELKIQHPWES